MKKTIRRLSIIFLPIFFLQTGCSEKSGSNPTFIYREPTYSNIALQVTTDTIDLQLAPKTTTEIASSNYFTKNGQAYLAWYDKITKIVSFYTFPQARLITTVPIKSWLTGTSSDKASVQIRNFDSIFVTTMKDITIHDTSSLIKSTLIIPKSGRPLRIPKSENQTPLIMANGTLFANIAPYIDERSVAQHKSWKLLFGFDLSTGKEKLYYQFPEVYREDIYGYSYLNYGYCLNNNNKFVFSFPADTNIYETDFADYHHSYMAKSKYQDKDILPITKDDIDNGRSFQEYSLRDSYSSIYFDPYHKRYLRLAKLKMDESSLLAKFRIRKKSVIIMDENFKIIGEASLPENLDFNSIFFTADGSIYARAVVDRRPRVRYVKMYYSDLEPLHSTKGTAK